VTYWEVSLRRFERGPLEYKNSRYYRGDLIDKVTVQMLNEWGSNRGSTSGFRLRSGTHPINYPVIPQAINLRKTPAVRG
jgi:hypothetical protein